MKKLPIFLVLLCIFAFANSCRLKEDEYFKPSGNAESEWIMPLVYGELTVFNLVKVPQLVPDANGFITLVINKEQRLAPKISFSEDDMKNDMDFSYKDTIDLGSSLWRFVKDGIVDLQNPRLKVEIENGVGMSDSLFINRVWSKNALNGKIVDLQVEGNEYKNFYIPTAQKEPFQPSFFNFEFNKQNSTLWDVLLNFPRNIYIDARLRTKPTMDIEPFYNENYFVTGRINLEVPLAVRIQNLVLSDTLDFNMGIDSIELPSFQSANGQVSATVTRGSLELTASNQFPFEVVAKIYFVDNNYKIIDSFHTVPEGLVIPKGIPEANGIVKNSSKFDNRVTITTEQANKLRSAKKVIINVTTNTFNSNDPESFVRIYDFYKIGFGLIGDLNIETKF